MVSTLKRLEYLLWNGVHIYTDHKNLAYIFYPVVQWALNTAFRERYGSTPYYVMFGRAPRTALSTLASSTGQDWQVDVRDDKALRKTVQSVVEVRSQPHNRSWIRFRRNTLSSVRPRVVEFAEFCRRRVRPGSSGAAQRLDADILS